MSEKSALTELAEFVAKSPLASDDISVRQAAINATVRDLVPLPKRRKVSDLLGTVLALSARTRRMVQPRVGIDLDVFAPNDTRAVVLRFENTEQ